MERIKEAFRGVFIKELKPAEDKEGVRIGDNVRVYKNGDKFLVRFLKGTVEKDRKKIRDRLNENKIPYSVGDDFTL